MDLSAELLGFGDLRTKKVAVPVWKRELTIRELCLQDSLALMAVSDVSEDGKATIDAKEMARVVALGVIDPDTGERVFADKDVAALARKNRRALVFLFNEISALSGSIEDAEKN